MNILNKVIPTLVVILVMSSVGFYLDFQNTKAEVELIKQDMNLVKRNHKLICYMSIQLKMDQKEVAKFCIEGELK